MQGIINGAVAFMLLVVAAMIPVMGVVFMFSEDDSTERACGGFLIVGWISGLALWALVSMVGAGLLHA